MGPAFTASFLRHRCAYGNKLSLKPVESWMEPCNIRSCSVRAKGPELGRPFTAAEALVIFVYGEDRLFDQHIFLIGSGLPWSFSYAIE